jgi:hypothetical protein
LKGPSYQTPNIDRIANDGMIFTDYYAQQSCTAGRAAFITGQSTIRTGLTKVGMPGARVSWGSKRILLHFGRMHSGGSHAGIKLILLSTKYRFYGLHMRILSLKTSILIWVRIRFKFYF